MSAWERFDFAPLRRRLLGRGVLRYAVLDLLRERPQHGYEIIEALRDRFAGLYAPSPGAIYPLLRRLEQRGYVVASEQLGRRVYTLLDEGKRLLAEQEPLVQELRRRLPDLDATPLRQEARALRQELREAGRRLTLVAPASLSPEKLRRVRAVVGRAIQEIEAILSEQPAAPAPPAPAASSTAETH